MLAERYRLDAPLGHGGMGEVWRAWDTRLSRPVAVKLLPGSAVGDDALAAGFRREARTAALITHPQVVAVYDFGVSQRRCFLVMEFVDGSSLADELRRDGPLSPDRVVSVAAGVAEGLAAAHRQGVVHRDVKPSNLLVAGDGTVKVADFGIARRPAADTTTGAAGADEITGTSLYLAPESALGERAGTAADVYSLGCALYELLTGQPPFVAEHPLAVLCLHVESEPTAPGLLRPQVPDALGGYLLRMLAKDPESRPTAQEAADWFAREGRRSVAGEAAGAAGLSDVAGLSEATGMSAAETGRGPHDTVSVLPAASALTERTEAPGEPAPARPTGRRGKALAGAAAIAGVLTVVTLALTTPWTGDANRPSPSAVVPHSAVGGGGKPSRSATADPGTPPGTLAAPADLGSDDGPTPGHGHGHGGAKPGHHAHGPGDDTSASPPPGPGPGPTQGGSDPHPSASPTPSSPTPTPTAPTPTPSSSGG